MSGNYNILFCLMETRPGGARPENHCFFRASVPNHLGFRVKPSLHLRLLFLLRGQSGRSHVFTVQSIADARWIHLSGPCTMEASCIRSRNLTKPVNVGASSSRRRHGSICVIKCFEGTENVEMSEKAGLKHISQKLQPSHAVQVTSVMRSELPRQLW